MSAGKFDLQKSRGRTHSGVAAIGLRLLLAAVGAGATVGMASAAMLFSTAPKWLSLIFEPISLLLLPGLAAGVAQTSPHDLEASVVLWASLLFYFVFFFCVLEWRARRRRRS